MPADSLGLADGADAQRPGTTRKLAFDHARILADGVERARSKLEYTPLATAFVGEEFTISELRAVYETVWGEPLHAGNFHRKVLSVPGFVESTGTTTERGGARGAAAVPGPVCTGAATPPAAPGPVAAEPGRGGALSMPEAMTGAKAISRIEAASHPGDLFGKDPSRTYRRLARLTHPDARPGDARAARAFAKLDRLTVDREALLATPYHRAANRARERARGDHPHGSCGVGIGETASYALDHPADAPRIADCEAPRTLERKLNGGVEGRGPRHGDPRWTVSRLAIILHPDAGRAHRGAGTSGCVDPLPWRHARRAHVGAGRT